MKNRGFTLVELVIVIAIIGVLISLVTGWREGVIEPRDVHSYQAPPSINPECRNGYLMNGTQAITDKNGAVVKC